MNYSIKIDVFLGIQNTSIGIESGFRKNRDFPRNSALCGIWKHEEKMCAEVNAE